MTSIPVASFKRQSSIKIQFKRFINFLSGVSHVETVIYFLVALDDKIAVSAVVKNLSKFCSDKNFIEKVVSEAQSKNLIVDCNGEFTLDSMLCFSTPNLAKIQRKVGRDPKHCGRVWTGFYGLSS